MNKTPRQRFDELLGSFTSGMLITRNDEDSLRGRPMHLARIESNADVWFTTRIDFG